MYAIGTYDRERHRMRYLRDETLMSTPDPAKALAWPTRGAMHAWLLSLPPDKLRRLTSRGPLEVPISAPGEASPLELPGDDPAFPGDDSLSLAAGDYLGAIRYRPDTPAPPSQPRRKAPAGATLFDGRSDHEG
jgi:hypothetical protein